MNGRHLQGNSDNCSSSGFVDFVPFFLVVALFFPNFGYADAPKDINNNQRAWFDGVDVNANDDYTDNPANNAVIAEWRDKSGSSNHVSGTAASQPTYVHNVLSTSRHGLDFDGTTNVLIDNDDIWVGAVNASEIFFVASTDQVKTSFNFLSTDFGTNRLGSHIPWSNGDTFFDQGICCGNPARLRGTVPIVLNEGYIWQYIGLPTLQSVVRNGDTLLSDGGAGVYNTNPNTKFSMGGHISSSTLQHHGHIYEAIFYQTSLNDAQRRILNSYLAAKWDRTMTAGGDYSDVYDGDNTANGNYDFFVGGIGQDSGLQSIGTSQGLTISDLNFLSGDDKFVLAGVDYLLTVPTIGLLNSDLPAGYSDRSNRTWYIDTTGTGGIVSLTFDATEMGLPVNNGRKYGLLYRPGQSGAFTELDTSIMSGGQVSYSLLPDDGVYAIGIIEEIELTILKTVSDESPNVGDVVIFTLAISNAGPDPATGASVNDVVPSGFGNLSAGSAPFPSSISISGNTVDWTDISIGVGSTSTVTFSAEVLSP